jgi:glycine dehydrogenase
MTEPTTEIGDFAHRHIGPAATDLADMLAVVGVGSMNELIDRAVPEVIRSSQEHDLPGPLTETETLDRLRRLADDNEVFTSLIGMGYSGTITPSVIRRNLLENPGWYTAYTPYQPEISQGRLEALLNFQTMVSDLTGMDIANASLLDEGTAAAEAMAMLKRVGRNDGMIFLVDDDLDVEGLGTGLHHLDGLGMGRIVNEEDHPVVAPHPFQHRHRLGRRGALIEKRRIGDIHAGEV